MARNDTTSAIIDGLLKFALTGGALATTLVLPNAIQALDKPLSLFFKKMDKRAQDRELRRLTTYMKSRGLVSGSYEHGLTITKKGKKRAQKADFEHLVIPKPKEWDKQWRLVLFDIPERYKTGRDALTAKLRYLGFQRLQLSVWIHPFPCRQELEIVTINFNINKYVTYLETAHIDNNKLLKQRFSHILNG